MEPSSEGTVFVQIASYRDAQCQHTIEDLFTKAARPERVFVGVCHQFDAERDGHLFEIPYRYPEQVRELRYSLAEAKGACWARNQTQKLWRGETYTLQVDAHTRFVEGWDQKLIDTLEGLRARGVKKPILSHLPPGFTLEGTTDDWYPTGHRLEFDAQGVPLVKMLAVVPRTQIPAEPTLGAYLVAGFIFARAELIAEVPYDPHIFFIGEEVTFSVRAFTHGWDIYHPNGIYIYHLYRAALKDTKEEPPVFRQDHSETDLIDKRSRARVKALIARQPCTIPGALDDLDLYGFGQVRTLKMFERFAGVRFDKQSVSLGPALGLLDPALAPVDLDDLGAPRLTAEAPWSPEALADRLKTLLPLLNVESVADLPCGNHRFGQLLAREVRRYVGADLRPSVIRQVREQYASASDRIFVELNLLKDVLPSADLMVSRDFITRLPNARVTLFLDNLRDSRYRYLLLDHFPLAQNDGRTQTAGERRPINLCQAPFHLPEPWLLLPDGPPGRAMALWRMADIELYLRAASPRAAKLRLRLLPALADVMARLTEAFADHPKLLIEMCQAFFQGASAHKAFIEARTDIFTVLAADGRKAMGVRNNLYKLIYAASHMQLSSDFPPIAPDEEQDARILARDYVAYWLDQRGHSTKAP